MANRFPLIINSISQIIEELPASDNLDLTSSNIVNAGSIQATSFSGDGSALTNVTANTVSNATQANITSLGTLTSLAVTGNITSGNANLGNAVIANFFIGSANNLSNIQGSNVSGAVGLATFATTANAVAGANVSGQVGNALIAGTVYTNAQPNITSVGSLTALTVTGNSSFGNVGNVSITGGINGYVLSTNGSGNLNWVAQSGGGGGSSVYEQIFLMMGA